MKPGRISFFYFFFIFFLFFQKNVYAVDKIEIVPILNLDQLPATFEEEEFSDKIDDDFEKNYKSNENLDLSLEKDKEIYVNLKALDKITAKTSSIKIAIGEKKYFGKLEIKPLKCGITDTEAATDTVAYIQVKDLSSKDNNQVFIFNGWTFASSPTLRSIDHPIYDLWLTSCENI